MIANDGLELLAVGTELVKFELCFKPDFDILDTGKQIQYDS